MGKTEAALAFAAGLACPDGGCGACATCRRVQEGLHPDVEIVAPEGNFIRKEEITEINLHAVYRPYEARAKVYIFLEADSFNIEAANAFLKTLEEPPGHVHFILVTDRPERLLPTIASRCQPVAFSPVPAPAMAADLRQPVRAAPRRRRSSSPGWPEGICATRGSWPRRRAPAASGTCSSTWPGIFPRAGLLDTEMALDDVMASVEAAAAERGARARGRARAGARVGGGRPHAQVAGEAARGEDQAAAAPSAHPGPADAVTRVFAGWYRDLALVSVGAEDGGAQSGPARASCARRPSPDGLPAYTRAVLAVRRPQERLRYNVDARCAIGDMFRSIKEALTQWPMS